MDPRRPDASGGELDYSGSATAITADLTPVGGVVTVTGQGDDTVFVGEGPPPGLRGSNLADLVLGSPGDDHILGMGGDDVLEGRAGRDYLRGEDGCVQRSCAGRPLDHDVVRGGEGDDDVASAWGLDDLEGGDGADFVTAGYLHGAHTISGGTGNDAVVVYVRASIGPGHRRW